MWRNALVPLLLATLATPAGSAETDAGRLILPIEVLGADGTTVTQRLVLDAKQSEAVKSLWLQVHGLRYPEQASVTEVMKFDQGKVAREQLLKKCRRGCGMWRKSSAKTSYRPRSTGDRKTKPESSVAFARSTGPDDVRETAAKSGLEREIKKERPLALSPTIRETECDSTDLSHA